MQFLNYCQLLGICNGISIGQRVTSSKNSGFRRSSKQMLADFAGILVPISNVFLNNQLTFQPQFQSKRLRTHCFGGPVIFGQVNCCLRRSYLFQNSEGSTRPNTQQIFPDKFWSNKNQAFDGLQSIKITLQYEK